MNKNKKPLLTEQVTSRFMKLANLDNLSQKFLRETFKEEETVKKEEEGKNLSQSPINKGGNKVLAEKDLEEENKDLTEALPPDESETPPEAPTVPDAATHGEPDGDEMGMGDMEMGNESMVQDLVKALADVITSKTGVAVDVNGSGVGSDSADSDMETDMEPATDMPQDLEKSGIDDDSSKMQERMGHRDHSGASYGHGQPQEENLNKKEESKQLKEEFSQSPKVTNQNKQNQGTIKDPTKGQVKLQGTEKPDPYLGKSSAGYPHKMAQLEHQITQRVYSRILEDLKKFKALKESSSKNIKPSKK